MSLTESPYYLWRAINLGQPVKDEQVWNEYWDWDFQRGPRLYWGALAQHFTERGFTAFANSVESWKRSDAVTIQVPEHLVAEYSTPGAVKFLLEGSEPSVIFLEVYQPESFESISYLNGHLPNVSEARAYEVLDHMGAGDYNEQELLDLRHTPDTLDWFRRTGSSSEQAFLPLSAISSGTVCWYPHELPKVDRNVPVYIPERFPPEMATLPVVTAIQNLDLGEDVREHSNISEAFVYASELIRDSQVYAPSVSIYQAPLESADSALLATVRPALTHGTYGLMIEKRSVPDEIQPESVLAIGFLPWV